MREIKFRIWDMESEQYFYWDITQKYPGCLLSEYIRDSSEQFTGLFDSKGKDIYEGDKIKYHTSLVEHEMIIDCDPGFFVAIHANIRFHLFDMNMDQVEVIGNIHQGEN